MPFFGPPDIETLKTESDVPGLIEALGCEADAGIRAAAAGALGQIGDARAVEPLAAALRDHDEYVRWFSAEAWGRMSQVGPLIDGPGNTRTARAAAEALVALYQSGMLDAQARRLLLAQRPNMPRHVDSPHDHVDGGLCHADEYRHNDIPGIEFPSH